MHFDGNVVVTTDMKGICLFFFAEITIETNEAIVTLEFIYIAIQIN